MVHICRSPIPSLRLVFAHFIGNSLDGLIFGTLDPMSFLPKNKLKC